MNELETDKISLKIGAHNNIEKQKSQSILKSRFFRSIFCFFEISVRVFGTTFQITVSCKKTRIFGLPFSELIVF